MSKEPLTHSDRYVRKTNRIILIIGIISLVIFLFGLMLLVGDQKEEVQHYEIERSIDAETNFGLTNDTNNEAEIEFDEVDMGERPITLEPNPINMGQLVLGNEASNVLTIGTNGRREIKIVSIELEDAPFEGFTYETNCENKELRGKVTCNVTMKWLPTIAANVQNNFKIIWHETNVSDSSSKHDEVPVYGNAITKEECNYCDSGITGVSTAPSQDGGKLRYAVGPDGKIIGVIGEDGLVYDENGNQIGRINAMGMIVDKNDNIIGVSSNGKLILDENGKVIGYVDEKGVAYDNDGNVIGSMLSDGSIIDSAGKILGKAVEYGYVYDDEGNILGRVLPDGSVVDLDGNVIGKVDKDGNVVDMNNNIIGHVAKSGEVVFDENGNKIGVVMPDGTVVDEDGNIVGRLNPDGTVTTFEVFGKKGPAVRIAKDANGNAIGYIDENGNVRDFRGNIIGKVDDSGNIVDLQGNIIGKFSDDWLDLAVDEQGNVIGYIGKRNLVLDKDGNVIGYIDENGNARDLHGNIIGRVDSNGNVLDTDGNIIGKVSDTQYNMAIDGDGNIIGYLGDDGRIVSEIVTKDGKIRFWGRKIIGSVINRNLLPITPSGKVLGTINNQGEVINQKKIVGKMRPDGLVTDISGSKILAKGINAGYIVNWGCDYSRKLDKDGVVRRDGQETDDRVYADGTVWTSAGEFVGKVITTGSVYDNNCNYVGEANADGYVRDANNNEIGCLNPDGTVLDLETPRIKGHLVNRSMVVSAEDWKPLGVLEANGTLKDSAGRVFGCANAYGDVFDKNMTYIGFANDLKYAYGFDGSYLGTFGNSGNLKLPGSERGYAIFDNLVVNSKQQILGYAVPEISVLIDSSGNILGHLFPDGNVYDVDGSIVDKFNGGISGIYNGVAAKFVQPQHMVDINGNKIGRINYDLNVVDYKGSVIGKANARGQMFDENGRLVAGVVKQGAVRGYNGVYLGYVISTGEVVEQESIDDNLGRRYSKGDITGNVTPDGHIIKNKQIIGEVLPQGIMVDVLGNIIGVVSDRGVVISPDGTELSVLLPGGGNMHNYTMLRSGIVLDIAGNTIGVALPNGSYMDSKHIVAAKVSSDGSIINSDGKILGEVVKGDIVIGADDKVKGWISFDGTVYNKGTAVGKVLNDGLAVDNQNNIIGRSYNIGNTILSNNGEYIGRLSATGRVVDDNNEIGYIKSDGSFVDMDKKVSGYSLPEVVRSRRN